MVWTTTCHQGIGPALADESEDVRTRVLEVLEGREGVTAIGFLVCALPNEPERLLRMERANALDVFGGDVAEAAIHDLVEVDPDEHGRAVAASK